MKFITWFLISLRFALAVNLEAENSDSGSSGKLIFRSAASGGYVINQRLDDYSIWHFNTTTSCEVVISGVCYSNDGGPDTIELQIDDSSIGNVTTAAVSQNGHQWNIFRSSGTVGNPVTLSEGQHTLKLTVIMADEFGVDIDKVTLNGPCIVGSSPTQTSDAKTGTPLPDTTATTNDGITESTGGSAGPTGPLTTAEIVVIAIGAVGLLISAAGIIIAAYTCSKKHFKNKKRGYSAV